MKRKANQYSISLAEQQCLLTVKQGVHKQDCQPEQGALRREKTTSVILVLSTECPEIHNVSAGNLNKVTMEMAELRHKTQRCGRGV